MVDAIPVKQEREATGYADDVLVPVCIAEEDDLTLVDHDERIPGDDEEFPEFDDRQDVEEHGMTMIISSSVSLPMQKRKKPGAMLAEVAR